MAGGKGAAHTRLWREYRGTLLFLFFMFCFRSAWADWVRVPTGSMNPTIIEGDRLLVDKHSLGLRVPFTRIRLTPGDQPERGDIVVFDSPADGTSLVKRVAAVPGDVVELEGDVLVINGRRARYEPGVAGHMRDLLRSTAAREPLLLRESGLGMDHDVMFRAGSPPREEFGPMTVPANMYFMLGDNRDNSADSRFFGFVPRRNIVGRATRVVVSLNPENYYIPRRNRFLAPLQ
jgi:signal peptidase I